VKNAFDGLEQEENGLKRESAHKVNDATTPLNRLGFSDATN